MDGGFGDDVRVQAVAEVDRVNVVAGAKLACNQQDEIPTERRSAI